GLRDRALPREALRPAPPLRAGGRPRGRPGRAQGAGRAPARRAAAPGRGRLPGGLRAPARGRRRAARAAGGAPTTPAAGRPPTRAGGRARVSVLSDGTIALDGGAMFGVVPRVVWEKRLAPDDRNRVTLGLNVALVESGGKRVLVDTGMGDRWGEKERGMYLIDRASRLDGGLRAGYLAPAVVLGVGG